jgi:hypothetical protein
VGKKVRQLDAGGLFFHRAPAISAAASRAGESSKPLEPDQIYFARRAAEEQEAAAAARNETTAQIHRKLARKYAALAAAAVDRAARDGGQGDGGS